ncbi:MAG: hypothetical protein HC916_06265 [Coleofasciculaceae cyanobacterium SM2_1_6]|nr:hypothetical protein [Coleofasciculaceae cyanobacterium SM2_1_6]
MTTTNGNNNGTDRLDLLTDQIGRLTEQIAQSNIAIAAGFAQTSANIDKLGEKIDNGFFELKAIAQAQQQDINRLVTVTDRQTQTVDRLSLMLERLLSERGQDN